MEGGIFVVFDDVILESRGFMEADWRCEGAEGAEQRCGMVSGEVLVQLSLGQLGPGSFWGLPGTEWAPYARC